MNNYDKPYHYQERPLAIELIRSAARGTITAKQTKTLNNLLRSPADSKDAFIIKPAADFLQTTPNQSNTNTLFGDFWYEGELCILFADTNVGKSTIMNLLSKSEVLAENKLFATLDTTTRKIVYENTPFLLSDTVGFIRKLPHHLVESFKSTLDEVREADILLHVVDISHPKYEDQIGVVNKTLQELKSFEKPIITVFNKMDQYEKNTFDQWLPPEVKVQLLTELKERWQQHTNSSCVFISAIEKTNITELRQIVLNQVRKLYQAKYPYKAEFFY